MWYIALIRLVKAYGNAIGSIPILGVSVVQVHILDLQQTRLATEKQNCDCLFVALNCSQTLSFTGGKYGKVN